MSNKSLRVHLILLILLALLWSLQVQCGQFQQSGSLLTPHSTIVVSVIISPDQSFMVTGASQNILKIWNTSSLALIASHTYGDIITTININQTDFRILVGVNDGTISILDGTTFLQIDLFTYPNAGKVYSIVLPKYQSQYYGGGNDVTVPIIHTFNCSDNTQNDTGVITSFTSGNSIKVMDYYFTGFQNYLAVISNQNTAPFRMVIHNVNSGIDLEFDEATGQLTYVKFCFQGQSVFTSSMDNKLRWYQLNSELQQYFYKNTFDTSSYGTPHGITCQNQQNLIVAVGQYLLMIKAKQNKMTNYDSYLASGSDISNIYELNGKIVIGCIDGSVKLLNVSYPSVEQKKQAIIISGSILAGLVLLGLIVAGYGLFFHNIHQITQQEMSMSSTSSKKNNSDEEFVKKDNPVTQQYIIQEEEFNTTKKIIQKQNTIINVK